MKVKDIEKLEQADQLMFTLSKSKNQKCDLLKVGQILTELEMIKDKNNSNLIFSAYQRNVNEKIEQALKPELAAIVSFNLDSLKPYLNSDDQMKKTLVQECLNNFRKYFLIVLRFNDKKNAWKKEKNTAEFQRLFTNMDQTRHIIHNNCINNIAAINRMLQLDHAPHLFASWDNPQIKSVKDIPRSDIGNAILLLMLSLTRSNFDANNSYY